MDYDIKLTFFVQTHRTSIQDQKVAAAFQNGIYFSISSNASNNIIKFQKSTL